MDVLGRVEDLIDQLGWERVAEADREVGGDGGDGEIDGVDPAAANAARPKLPALYAMRSQARARRWGRNATPDTTPTRTGPMRFPRPSTSTEATTTALPASTPASKWKNTSRCCATTATATRTPSVARWADSEVGDPDAARAAPATIAPASSAPASTRTPHRSAAWSWS